MKILWLIIFKIPLYVLVQLLELLIGLLGIVVVPFIDNENNPIWGNKQDPVPRDWYMPGKPYWLRFYLWHTKRNATNNLRFLMEDPPLSRKYLNPDVQVRDKKFKSFGRFINEGWLFFEYWKVWSTKNEKRPYGEFRIGWKFSGVEGFGIVTQLRRGG